jgi:hypothetical protein
MREYEEKLNLNKIVEIAKSNGFNLKEKHYNIGISQLDVHYDYISIFNDPEFLKYL